MEADGEEYGRVIFHLVTSSLLGAYGTLNFCRSIPRKLNASVSKETFNQGAAFAPPQSPLQQKLCKGRCLKNRVLLDPCISERAVRDQKRPAVFDGDSTLGSGKQLTL